MELTEGIVAGVVVSLLVAAFARSRGWGIALPVLFAGILFGFLPFGPSAPDDAGSVFLLVLAPLVFGEALSASYVDIRRVSRPVLALAVGLVVVSSVAVGAVASAVIPGIPLAIALALGAVLSPTDAVSVAAIARRVGLPHRLVTILEGESLVNDGTGLTLLRVALVSASAGAVTGGQALGILALAVLGGIGVGALVGFLLVLLMRRSTDSLVVNVMVLIAPFPAYFGAEAVQGSGILAVVTTALIAANAMTTDSSFRGRPASVAAWRQITFILQAFAFFLVGLELPETVLSLDARGRTLVPVLVALILVTLLLARLVFVGAMVLFGKAAHRGTLGWRGGLVLAWAGARGPVSGLAAFTIPSTLASGEPFPDRPVLLATTFMVITATLLLAPTLGIVARWVGVTAGPEEDEVRRVRAALAGKALEQIDDWVEEGIKTGEPAPEEIVTALRTRYNAELRAAEGEPHPSVSEASVVARYQRGIIKAQQEELLRLRDSEAIPDAVVRPIMHGLDAELAALRQRPLPG
ncbi:MAG: cation:proton antiporter [bacterium]